MRGRLGLNISSPGIKMAELIILALVITILALISNVVWGWTEIDNLSAITAGLGAAGTLLLAWSTIRTLEQNKNLMEHQQQQLKNQEAQYRPLIRKASKFSTDEDNQNVFLMELENSGEGKAVNLRLNPELYIKDDWPYKSLGDYLEDLDGRIDIPTIVSRPTKLSESSTRDKDIIGKSGILESGETKEFYNRIDYLNTDSDMFEHIEIGDVTVPNAVVFSRLLDVLEMTDVEVLGFRFVVEYEDVLGNEYTEAFRGPLFKPDDVDSLSGALDNPLWDLEIDNKLSERMSGEAGASIAPNRHTD